MRAIFEKLRGLLARIPLTKWQAAAFVVVIAFGIAYLRNEQMAAQNYERTHKQWSLIARPISPDDHRIGSLTAPVQILMYADLSCKYCKGFLNQTLPALQKKWPGKFVVAYRHLPLRSHPGADVESHASECVYNQLKDDGFWQFAQGVYAEPAYESGLTLSELRTIAVRVGAKGEEFDECMRLGTTQKRVADDTLEASVAGLTITPSFILKSATRALVVEGNYYGSLDSSIAYLLSQ